MRSTLVGATISILALSALGTTRAMATPPGVSVRVDGPPATQHLGHTYIVRIIIRNTGRFLVEPCILFRSGNHAWKVVMPGIHKYDFNVFCRTGFKAKSKQLVARVMPTRTGHNTLEICVGRAQIILDNKVAVEPNQLCWHDTFVVSG